MLSLQGGDNGYTLLNKIGEGSFGEVWKALNNGSIVAIKFIKKLQKKYDYVMERELYMLQAISEKCKPYGVCYIGNGLNYSGNELNYSGNGLNYIIMEYIDGYDLKYLLGKISLKDRQNITKIIHDLIVGIKQFHDMGIVHQDIKEENIKWDKISKNFRFMDWGGGCLEKSCKDNKCYEPCGYSGTQYTQSPEIRHSGNTYWRDEFDYSKAHDVWSVGVVLFNWFFINNIGGAYSMDLGAKKNQNEIDAILESKKTENNIDDSIFNIINSILKFDRQERLSNFNNLFKKVDLSQFNKNIDEEKLNPTYRTQTKKIRAGSRNGTPPTKNVSSYSTRSGYDERDTPPTQPRKKVRVESRNGSPPTQVLSNRNDDQNTPPTEKV